jgi:hypothetical protein
LGEPRRGAFGCDGANEPRWNGEVALDGGLVSEESEDGLCMTEVRLELLGSINHSVPELDLYLRKSRHV